MSAIRTLIAATLVAAVLNPAALDAQSDRIWGSVTTTDGTLLEGFLRWDRNEVGWVDLLNGSKELPEDLRTLLAEARQQGAEIRDRSIEYAGYRITWDDSREMLPTSSDTGIRFGYIERLVPDGDDAVLVTLRGGQEVRLQGGSTDIGTSFRGLVLEAADGDRSELDWDDFTEVRLSEPPPGVSPGSARLWGTATDRDGEQWTGWIAWDTNQLLSDDLLRGEVEDGGADHAIPFGSIERIERIGFSRARVHVRDRAIVDLRDAEGSTLVGDVEFGQITIPWNELYELRLYAPTAGSGAREVWDGGRLLRGSVERADGEIFTGIIRWDGDEGYDWEILDGRVGDVDVDVEFSRIARIEPAGPDAARVTLRDGREFEIHGSNDVNADNRGIFVQAEGDDWIYVDWYDVAGVTFDRGDAESAKTGQEDGR